VDPTSFLKGRSSYPDLKSGGDEAAIDKVIDLLDRVVPGVSCNLRTFRRAGIGHINMTRCLTQVSPALHDAELGANCRVCATATRTMRYYWPHRILVGSSSCGPHCVHVPSGDRCSYEREEAISYFFTPQFWSGQRMLRAIMRSYLPSVHAF
jgi:hypothetical protein